MKHSPVSRCFLLFLGGFLLAAHLGGCFCPPRETITYESETDRDGNTYYIINPNHFDFSHQNVLEVVLSDTEWFVLYGQKDKNNESGYGEWFVDGESIPIYFRTDQDFATYLHDDILIGYIDSAYLDDGKDKRPEKSDSRYIAKISNDSEDPWLRWCIDGDYIYSPKFAEEYISVKYRRYRREECGDVEWLSKSDYVPLSQSPYYAIPDDMTAVYASADGSFAFDARTEEGTWTVGETVVPVIGSFDMGRFTFSLSYNTGDERQGQVLLTAEGTKLCEDKAEYRITYRAEEFGNVTLTALVLQKTWVSPSDEWTDFTSAEDGTHTVFRCEKGNFSYDATAKEGTWITNGTEVSICIEFDPLRYEMNVFDVSTGEKILNAKGYLQDDHTAVFTEYEGSMFYKNSLGDIVIEKIITE